MTTDDPLNPHDKVLQSDQQHTQSNLIDSIQSHPDFTFKSLHVNESNPSPETIHDRMREILDSDPGLFLEKWGKFLTSEQDLCYFESFKETQNDDDYVIDYYLKEYRQRLAQTSAMNATNSLSKSKIRNRRLFYLSKNPDYFSLESMKSSFPDLYEEYVERYIPQSEKLHAFQGKGLVDRILYDLDQKEYLEQIGRLGTDNNDSSSQPPFFGRQFDNDDQEEFEEEFDDEEEDVIQSEKSSPIAHDSGDIPDSNDQDKPCGAELDDDEMVHTQDVSAAERESFIQDLISLVQEAFLNGMDPHFDYSTVDRNDYYDDLKQMTIDAEDRYFSDED